MSPLTLYLTAGWFANVTVLLLSTAYGYRTVSAEYRANALRGDAFLAICPWCLLWFIVAQEVDL